MKILVCDDRESNCNYLVERIQEATNEEKATVKGLSSTKLEKTLKEFFRSIELSLRADAYQPLIKESLFDDYDLIVIDNNLTHLKFPGGRLTAESIAGYIRAFSAGKYIISVNKNPDVDFDLRFLIGDYRTQADLALNDTHLGNRALWTGNPIDSDDGFIPWYWPSLKGVAERRKEQIDFVRKRLDEPVFSSLAFKNDTIGFLSYHAIGALSPDDKAYSGDVSSIPRDRL